MINIIMTKVISALEARNNLGALIDSAATYNTRYLIKKRNEAAVVLLSARDYLQTVIQRNPAVEAVRTKSGKTGGDRLTAQEITAIIREARDDQNRS